MPCDDFGSKGLGGRERASLRVYEGMRCDAANLFSYIEDGFWQGRVRLEISECGLRRGVRMVLFYAI